MNKLTTNPTYIFVDPSKIPMNIVCNGFVMKDVILDVLTRYQAHNCLEDIDSLANDIQQELANKLRLIQG